MFELTVQAKFSAAHAITIRGRREPLHGHDFRVTATISGPDLDGDGLLVDFHAVERALRDLVGPWNNRTLNEIPPFDRLNPTAENIARHIGEQLAARLAPMLPRSAAVTSVRVGEAPGCAAAYRPG